MTDKALLELAERLCSLDKQLLLGACDGWGSWMFDSGEYMCGLGLGRKHAGSIYFDTPLAKELIGFLRARASMED
jgi:hypothetical protein